MDKITSKDRGFRYAFPAVCLAAFHMVVAYAILGVGTGFKGGDFIPGLFEGLIGIAMYGGLAVCVISAIINKRCQYILDFIGLVAAARLLLPIIGMIGGGFVIAFVIMIFIVGALSVVAGYVLVGVFESLSFILGPLASVFAMVFVVLEYVLPILGILMIASMAISALTGVVSGMASLGDIVNGILPLL